MAWNKQEEDDCFNDILKQIANGESLRSVLRQDGMPNSSKFYEWLKEGEERKKQYAHACEERQQMIFDEILEIADENNADVYKDDEGNVKIDGNTVQRSRLKIDARKWALGKMNPKKYGDKIDVTSKDKELKGTTIINLGGGVDPNESK